MKLLSGIVYPVSAMPAGLRYFAHILPLTYTVQGMHETLVPGQSSLVLVCSLVLVGFFVAFIWPTIKLFSRQFWGVFSTIVGDLALGSVGLTERAAREAGIEVVTGTAKAPDRHPGSMPGAKELGVKLIFTKDAGVIVGGQAYGGTAVGELTNLLAVAIQHKMRVDELETMQVGTHPALTASPIAYQVTNAAEDAGAFACNESPKTMYRPE